MRCRTPLLLSFAALLAACGGSEPTTPPTPKIDPTKPAAIALVSGDGQTVRVNTAVPTAPVFKVTNGNGSVLGNVTVSFAVSAGGGTLAATSATTGADGTVAVPAWTLGRAAGPNTVTATVSGLTPVAVSETARWPHWTVMVYMAADNTLALDGVMNLQQMAAAGVNPEVQVVVQAEFSPTQFAQAGCTAACISRPNFNTVRYVMDGSVAASASNPFAGPVTDIGNRNMTDPAQLAEFVTWARTTAPSEHTMLVLWNHGAGAGGLIADETSAPNVIMSLPQLASALQTGRAVDVLDFDMCLMGGYETLATVQPYAQAVVASEETEPGDGVDYLGLLKAMYANPTATATGVATATADAYDAYYVNKGVSTTIAAYNTSGFPAVNAAVTRLATALLHTTTSATTLAAGAVAAQRYEYRWDVDLVDLADSLSARTSDTAVLGAAAAVRSAVTAPTFLLRNKVRSGTNYGTPNVDRSRGLQIVLPADASTALPSGGAFGFAAYQQEWPSAAWTTFLAAWIPAVASSQAFLDLGANSLTAYVVWDSTLMTHGGDVDLVLLEPDGNLYGPIFGTISPSGVFSADSRVYQTVWEAWMSNRYVESGTFSFLAWLSQDPQRVGATVNVVSRVGTNAFQSLYGPGTYPTLDLSNSFLADPNATDQQLLANTYSDIKVVASWTPVGTAVDRAPWPGGTLGPSLSRAPGAAPAAVPPALSAVGRGGAIASAAEGNVRRVLPTPAQLRSLQRAMRAAQQFRARHPGATTRAIRAGVAEALRLTPQATALTTPQVRP